MEHGIPCCETANVEPQMITGDCRDICDSNYMRYVGWRINNACAAKYFSPPTVKLISQKITQLLQGVDPKGRPIVVPAQTICNIMSNVWYNFRPEIGDIYSRYIIPTNQQQSKVQNMIDQVIEIITSQVRTELGMIECNSKLTKWTTVLGTFNEHGLTQVPPIKVLHKRPNPMEFNMNY